MEMDVADKLVRQPIQMAADWMQQWWNSARGIYEA